MYAIRSYYDQRGEVLQPSEWWKEASLQGSINANDEPTFYVEHGDYIGRIAVFVSVFLLLLPVVKRFR